MFDADITRMIGLPYGEKNYDNMLSHFNSLQYRNMTDKRTDVQRDRQTQSDRHNCYINIARHCADVQ